jgi:hypothetical protein
MQTATHDLFPARATKPSEQPSKRFTFSRRYVFTRAAFNALEATSMTTITNLDQNEPAIPPEPAKDAHEKLLAAGRELLSKEPNRLEFKRFNADKGVMEDMPAHERLTAAAKIVLAANPKLAQRWKNENGKESRSSES